MLCGNCKNENDGDAKFCEHCGAGLSVAGDEKAGTKNRIYLYALLALVAVAALAVGYYKFFLPSGVAAVVNGEEISLAEVDAMMRGAGQRNAVPPEQLSRARYEVLSDLITERIALQEARKAGIRLDPAELDAAYAQLASASGRDQASFESLIKDRYGSVRAFRQALERRTVIRKYIAEKLTAGITDPATADARVNQWVQEITGRATVRIALAEQVPASGCGCCNNGPGGGSTAGMSAQAREAQQAALAYWKERYGDGRVDTTVRDLGCHVEVDVMQGRTIAKSLRYQNGTITEQ